MLSAIARLETSSTVTAQLRQQALIDGLHVYGTGRYWQQRSAAGSQVQVCLQLQSQVDGATASLWQVSNGKSLWTDRRTPKGHTVTWVDLRKLRTAASDVADELAQIAPNQATWSPIQPELSARSGGLPMLLASLRENFDFAPPTSLRLSDVPVFGLVGHWKPAKRKELWPVHEAEKDVAGKPPDGLASKTARLPTHVPASVFVLVGQDDFFPYLIEYRRAAKPGESTGQDKVAGKNYQWSAEPLLLIEFYRVQFDAPINPGQFEYSPGDTAPIDKTAEYTEQIQRLEQQRLATRQRPERR